MGEKEERERGGYVDFDGWARERREGGGRKIQGSGFTLASLSRWQSKRVTDETQGPASAITEMGRKQVTGLNVRASRAIEAACFYTTHVH